MIDLHDWREMDNIVKLRKGDTYTHIWNNPSLLRKLCTDRRIHTLDKHSSKDDEDILENRKTTVRGRKYDFIKKMMKKCNSTDVADVMLYCKNTKNTNYR